MRLFEKISAPSKKLIWFDHSAHFVFLEEPSRFAAEMRRVEQETADPTRPNESMKPTPKDFASRLARFRCNFSKLATTPCRGLSLSR
jgi:hypothetical protein